VFHLLLSILALLCVFPLFIRFIRLKKYDLFHIPTFFPFTFFLYHGAGIFFTMTRDKFLGHETTSVQFSYETGLLYAIFAIICFYFGYFASNMFAKLKINLSLRTDFSRSKINYLIIILIVGYFLANAAIWAYLGNIPLFISEFYEKRIALFKGMGYVWELGILSMVPVSIIALGLLINKDRQAKITYYFWGILFCIIVFFLCVINQTRGPIVSLIVPLIIFINYQRKRIRVFHGILIVAFLIVVLVGASFLRWSRTVDTKAAGFFLFSEIFTETDNYFDVIRNVPDKYPYQYGKTLIPLITNPVPRFILPEKSEYKSAGAIYKDYKRMKHILIGVRITFLGELFFNFGLIGITIGMFLWGIILGFFSKNLYPGFDCSNPLKVLLYSFITYTSFFFIAGDIVAATMATIQFLIPLFVFIALFGKLSMNLPVSKSKI